MNISVMCPKCKKKEELKLTETNMAEISMIGSTYIASYHADHVLLLCIGRHGIRFIDICDPPSQLIHSVNLYVGPFLLIRSPLIGNIGLLFADLEKKIIDARMVYNHMHALCFARFLSRSIYKDVCLDGPIEVYGLKYLVKKSDKIVVAMTCEEEKKTKVEQWLKQLVGMIRDVPIDINLLIKNRIL